MGYSINYSSVDPIAPHVAETLLQDVHRLCEGRTWLSCEPLFLSDDGSGRFGGGSKPSFEPSADDIAAARQEGLPDGTVTDVLEILCELSKTHGIDWEVGDDFEPFGFIRDGRADSGLFERIHAIGEFSEMAAEAMGELESDEAADTGSDSDPDDEDDEDFPPTIRLWTE